MDESDTGPHVVAFEGATYVIVPTTHVADEGDAVAPTVVVLVDISGGCPCCLNFVDCRCCCEHRCCSTFRPRCCGSGHGDDIVDGVYVLVTLVGGYDSGIRQCPVHSDVGLPRYPDCRLVHLVCSSLSAAVTGSMKAVPKAVLSASLFRLLSFLAKRVTPVVLMTYRHNVSWVDFVVRRTVLVQPARRYTQPRERRVFSRRVHQAAHPALRHGPAAVGCRLHREHGMLRALPQTRVSCGTLWMNCLCYISRVGAWCDECACACACACACVACVVLCLGCLVSLWSPD